MAGGTGFNKTRISLAIFLAEAIPILLLVAIVFVYSFLKSADSISPDEFAPLAGNWVGPIGGFFATLWFARWVARRAADRQILQGTIVGIGTALFDFSLAILLAGSSAIQPLFFASNAGRVLAGVLGGWLAARRTPGKP